MLKPTIFKIVSDTEAEAYCPQCKRYIMRLNDETQKDFPDECPHCKEPLSLSYLRLPTEEEGLVK